MKPAASLANAKPVITTEKGKLFYGTKRETDKTRSFAFQGLVYWNVRMGSRTTREVTCCASVLDRPTRRRPARPAARQRRNAESTALADRPTTETSASSAPSVGTTRASL